MADLKIRPPYQVIDGLICPTFPPHCIREALDYKALPGDVFVATYPKCGTTWMQTTALYIYRKGQEMDNPYDYHRLCPFIDAQGKKGIDEMPRPGTFKTHLPYTRMPYSPDAKYIYVLRNPKDTCVSMYYHTIDMPGYEEATFDEFFEIFMAGEVEYNDYFDHLMSWYPHLKDKQVFFATYEDMQKDLKDVVFRLAAFLGDEYIDIIQKDNNVLNNILHYSSFEYMKKRFSDVFSPKRKDKEREQHKLEVGERSVDKPKKKKQEHLRKGVNGDWRSHFSKEQSERLNKKFVERTKGTEIYEIFRAHMGL